MEIGARIRKIRLGKGVTQQYISRQLGKSTGWLSNIEQGRRRIAVDELEMVAKVLEVPVEALFKE